MTRTAGTLHWQRRALQTAFFTLFVLAPPLDLFRYDLTEGHFILFGQVLTLGLDGFTAYTVGHWEAAARVLFRFLLPLVGFAFLFLWLARRYGRLYCGWLCPHFSVVETINGLMRRAMGRPGLFEKRRLPERRADGRLVPGGAVWWLPTVMAITVFSCLWAIVFLTYLLPPGEVYSNLLNIDFPRNQALFLVAATTLLSLEFTLARHFFCRFGCAVGLFQSLAWMTKNDALVIGFDRDRAAACHDCDSACEHACPMRIKPRSYKRAKFTCTQCGECVRACEVVQGGREQSLLDWSVTVKDNAGRQDILPPWKNR